MEIKPNRSRPDLGIMIADNLDVNAQDVHAFIGDEVLNDAAEVGVLRNMMRILIQMARPFPVKMIIFIFIALLFLILHVYGTMSDSCPSGANCKRYTPNPPNPPT